MNEFPNLILYTVNFTWKNNVLQISGPRSTGPMCIAHPIATSLLLTPSVEHKSTPMLTAAASGVREEAREDCNLSAGGTKPPGWRVSNCSRVYNKTYNITHSHGRTTAKAYGKFDPSPRKNGSTDRPPNLHRWLRSGYLPQCKILCRSDKGFFLPICVKYNT